MNKVIYILIFVFFVAASCEMNKNDRPFGTLIEVPNEAASIQEAIGVAQNNDTILLHPGEYFEWDLSIKKAITIISMYAMNADSTVIGETIINSDHQSRTFTIDGVMDGVAMNGFTIKNAHAISKHPQETKFLAYNGGAIYCYNGVLNLYNMVIEDNSASEPTSRGTGGGLYIDESEVHMEKVEIKNNFSILTGGGIYCLNSKLSINDAIITNNTTVYGGPPIAIWSSEVDMKNTLFRDNENEFDIYPDIAFFSCNGTLDNVIVINDSVKFDDSTIELINCDIPVYK